MDKILIILFLLIGIIPAYPISSVSDGSKPVYEIPLDIEDSYDEDGDSNEEPDIVHPPRRHRMPGLLLLCEISRENGITISQSGISENIVSYEVYDSYGCCVAIFSDEAEFIDFLFSGISGEYILRFKTDNRAYSGMVCL